jgi:glycoprotein 6-alpha-L-fucosyltransferase
VAYGTERTLVLKSHGWRYNKKGFEDVFLPMSENCAAMPPGNHAFWPSQNAPVVELPIIDSVNPRPKFLPPSIPRDLSERIIRIHGDPIVWCHSYTALFLRHACVPWGLYHKTY